MWATTEQYNWIESEPVRRQFALAWVHNTFDAFYVSITEQWRARWPEPGPYREYLRGEGLIRVRPSPIHFSVKKTYSRLCSNSVASSITTTSLSSTVRPPPSVPFPTTSTTVPAHP